MKNHRSHTMEVAPELAVRLARFLEHYRSRFHRADNHDSLWPSCKGGAMSEGAIYHMVRKRTRLGLGRAVHPHLFRAAAATMIAVERPEQIDIAGGLLGHASLQTTAAHYIQARQVTASRLHNRMIEQLRTEARARGADQ